MEKVFWRGTHFPVLWLVFKFLIISLVVSGSTSKQAFHWSTPATISGISLDSYPPILVTDDNRTVHAFSSQWVGEIGNSMKAIFYTQWTLEQGWTIPIDIIISPVQEARVTDAFLDDEGIIHLVFYGGNGISGDIYYTRAYANAASDARSWSPPLLIGEVAGDPEGAVLVGTGHDLTVVYYGKRDGDGVYAVTTKDSGITWSEPTLIYLSDSDAPTVYSLRVTKGRSGWFHSIWNVYNAAGQGRGIYYASYNPDNNKWNEPIQLAIALDGLGTQTPTITEHDNVLFAVFNLTPKISMRRSFDDGATWSDPVILFPRHVGVNGSLSLVTDSNDNLHLFFGQRITGNPDIHGMWHSLWVNNRWTEPDAVIKGPRVLDIEGYSGFDPYEARAVVSQGNVLLVTWRTDPGDIRDNGVWYSYAVLNAPELPIATLQSGLSRKVDATITPDIVQSALPVETPQIVFDKERQGQNVFVWAGLAVVFLVIFRVIYIMFDRLR